MNAEDSEIPLSFAGRDWATVLQPASRLPLSQWAALHLRLPGSARSEQYDPAITPWATEPMDRCTRPEMRRLTYVKPVQSGGSVIGEAIICHHIANNPCGHIQYNWEDDEKAGGKWDKRVEPTLKATLPALWPTDRTLASRCQAVFSPSMTLTMQGVFTKKRLDSDTIALQVNEEVHGWEDGRLEKAFRRTTAVWNARIVNISNAAKANTQLHRALAEGSNEHAEVKCSGCGLYHAMFVRTEGKKPGGLRYDDAKVCKREDGSYDYPRMQSTIYYEFPCCGYRMPDDIVLRRALAKTIKYVARNTGAPEGVYSMTHSGILVDYIPFLTFIQEKHSALAALKNGDIEPYRSYVTERENLFWDPEDRPLVGKVILSDSKKDRSGLPGNKLRLFALDRQRGKLKAGEFKHWWLVIRDYSQEGPSQSLLVYEGKVLTNEDVLEVLNRHGCTMGHGAADSGWDTEEVYQFCLRNGINCIKGTNQTFFAHPGSVKRIYEPEQPLHKMVQAPSKYPYLPKRQGNIVVLMPDKREPMFWRYSASGIRDRLGYLRASTEHKFAVPSDVSEDYQRHFEAEEIEQVKNAVTGELTMKHHQIKERNDLYVCECYIAMLAEMAGRIGQTIQATK